MQEIKIGDELEVKYSLSVGDKLIKKYDISTIIVGNKYNLIGINKYINPFIGEDSSTLIGNKVTLHIPPEEGYGLTDNSKIGAVPKNLMDVGVTVGSSVDLSFKDGSKRPAVVKSENDDTFIVDCNHPLVNKNLIVDIKFLTIK